MNITDSLPIDGEKFVINGPKGEILKEAIDEAQTVVDKFSSSTNDHFKFPSPQRLWDDGENWNLWMVAKGEFSGTWPKRYQTMVYKKYGCRPPAEMTAKLGEILSRFANKEAEHLVDIISNAEWTPGEFGENTSSCWWHEYNHARVGLFSHGGLAFRFFYKNGKGLGRCWLYPREDRIYMFNCYHKTNLNLYNMACLLATHMGLSYKRVGIYAEHAYVNGETGFCVAPVDVLARFTGDRHDLPFADNPEDEQECACCSCTYGEDHAWRYDYQGNAICNDCYHERYFRCNHCRELFNNDDERVDNYGDRWCNGCWDDCIRECYDCGEGFIEADVVKIDDGHYYCAECAKKHVKKETEL